MSHRSYGLICPACGASGSPEFFLGEISKRTAILHALQLPHPLALQVQAYVGLFRPPSRAQSIERVEKLLSELLEFIQAGTVTRDRRTVPCSIEVWKAAIDVVLEQARNGKLSTPLKDHGYLLAVALSKAEEVAAEAERQAEEKKRNQPRLGIRNGLQPVGYDAQQAFEKEVEQLRKKGIVKEKDA